MLATKPATKTVALAAALALSAAIPATSALAQVRVANWNITNWTASNVSSRGSAFQTSFYGVVPSGLNAGKQFAPDVILVEEIIQGGTPNVYPIPSSYQTSGQNNVNAFVNLLNTASGSPGDWTAAPYVPNQGDTGNALFYRTSTVQLIDTTTLGCGFSNAPCGTGNATIDVGSGGTQSPRDNQRWRVRLIGYGAGVGSELYLYAGHLKASDGSAEQARKMPESTRVRSDAAALPAGSSYIFGADFNVQTSARNYYQVLVGSGTGQFFDPINRPGAWNADCSFRNIHTQEPTSASSGGMDDRHDQLLISGTLRDGQGISYIPHNPGGNILAPFVSSTGSCNSGASSAWFDANHSYRCWGNDGNHYNLGIADTSTISNTMVGQTIAQALITTCAGNGHLPVYLDLQVPARLGAPTDPINLGTVTQNSTVSYTLQVTNAADTARYSKDGTGWGIDGLSYSLAVTPGAFSISGGTGPFERTATAAPATANSHSISLDTTTPGVKNATLTITSDDPDNPTRVITLSATVQAVVPTGACCFTATGDCSVVLQTSCGSGSTWSGAATCTPNPCPQPPGACCNTATGVCTLVAQASCGSGKTWNGSLTCEPSPCPQPTGACCQGGACSTSTQAACPGVYQGNGIACGTPANPTTCCTANFDQINGLNVSDIFSFLTAWFNGSPSSDYDQSGTLQVADIFAFLNSWFAGC
jgi:hypothetical protein